MASYDLTNTSSNPSEKPKPGLFGVWGLRYEAWKEEAASDAEVRILSARQRVAKQRASGELAALQAKIQLAETEMDGRRRLLLQALQVEELEGEVTLRRQLRQSSPEGRRQILGAEVEVERLMLEREQLRQQRLSGTAPVPATLPAHTMPALPAPEEAYEEAEEYISDRQIETLALKAVTRFAALEPDEADRQWRRWREELFRRFPEYAAEEIAQRTDEMRGLVRR